MNTELFVSLQTHFQAVLFHAKVANNPCDGILQSMFDLDFSSQFMEEGSDGE